MIKTVADFLQELRAKELEAIQGFEDVGHQGMIGDMYEGLTRELLHRALFDGADLRVVSGKVRMPDGRMSRQMDAMVVVGVGKAMPRTTHWIYPPEQVVAIVEVKKSLYATALDEAYQNLRSINDDYYMSRIPREWFRSVYRLVAKDELPADGDLNRLPLRLRGLAETLMWDVALPARIVFGYDGYANEYTLREGFFGYLQRVFESGVSEGYGPAGLPSLILCGKCSLVKLNAMPYCARTDSDREWLVYGSSAHNPLRFLLEILWTQLAARGCVSTEVFGDDLDEERLNAFLSVRLEQRGSTAGWTYRHHGGGKADLAVTPASGDWCPTLLKPEEVALIARLCAMGELDTASDPTWSSFVVSAGDGLEASIARLRSEALAAIDHAGILRLLTKNLQVVCTPDLGWVAAENSSGRLTRWILRGLETKSGTETAQDCE